MSFTDHKIQNFKQTIANLPDEPNLSAEELKRCFDSSPEQLRQSVNGLCDEAERLHERVEGIVAETYEDTIHESMLDAPLQTKLNSKAAQSDLARTDQTVAALQTAVAQKCEAYFGSYVGNNATERTFLLGFRAKAVLLWPATGCVNSGYTVFGGLALDGYPITYSNLPLLEIQENGFLLRQTPSGTFKSMPNEQNQRYLYIAFQ